MELTEAVYLLCKLLPDSERFGLVSQMQRSAVSIPSNIVEGHGRVHNGDFVKHLSYARGSLAESETQIAISARVGHITRAGAAAVWDLCQQVGKMLTTLLRNPGREPRTDFSKG